MGARGRVLIGSYDDNLIELATLCLGGLVALAALYQPWLAVLVIAPMYTLQRGALVRELETAATTDAKTGLLNAVAWEQLAKRELVRGERERYSVAVLIIDIDRFKLVNDRFGHLAGDDVLRGIGRSLGGAMREYDTVGRFGGEEFVAVLPEADEISALTVAERVRSRVNRIRVSDLVEGIEPVDDVVLAVSIGVACTPVDGFELAELLHAADQALYRAKESGRNQVQLAYRGSGESPVRA
jgi:diguanylate cyclase